MNRAALVACGVLVAACTGAWAWPAAAIPSPSSCPTGEVCPQQQGPADSGYTVSKSASVNGHVEPGQTLTYTVTITANADVGTAGFTDDLRSGVLDDASFGGFVGNAHGAVYDSDVVSWVGNNLTSGQTVSISYAVRVDSPDTGDGVLHNGVEPSDGTGGECETCAVTNAVEGTFTVQESSSPQPGGTVQPGDTITYTVDVVAGDAPAYASFASSLSANADYAGDARASSGKVSVRDKTVGWSGKLDPGATATVTFSAAVKAADGGTGQLTSTVEPVSNDPYRGSCAPNGACQVSYRVSAPSGPGATSATPTAAATSGSAPSSTRSGAALPVSAPTSSVHIADTGAKTAGLSELAGLLLLGGLGLLLLGWAPGRRSSSRARHRH